MQFSIENEHLRVTVLAEGGHIAGIADKKTGVNPLWTPPWTSIEPSTYDPARHPDDDETVDSRDEEVDRLQNIDDCLWWTSIQVVYEQCQ